MNKFNLIICLFYFYNCISADTMTIGVVRYKSAFEQILNYGRDIEQYFKIDLKKEFFLKPNPPRDNDSIALKRWLNDEFYGEVVIGHPGQKLFVNFDTSWQLSWVMSSKCSALKSIGCYFHNKYDHSKSSEYRKDGRPFQVTLENFNMTGFYSYDNISIAHSNATNQSFVEIVTAPNSFLINKADGLIGLALKSNDYDPLFYTLLKQKKIKNPIFSIYLNRDTQSNRGGNIMLGFVDDKHIHKNVIKNQSVPENFTYLPVDGNSFAWTFNMDTVYVDYKEPRVLCPKGCKTTVDTSGNTILGPTNDINEIHDAIAAQELILGRYAVNCDTVNKLPKIRFKLGGKNFTLEGPDYTVKMSYNFITICLSVFSPIDSNEWVLGGAFLSNYYSVFNIKDRTIGFVRVAK